MHHQTLMSDLIKSNLEAMPLEDKLSYSMKNTSFRFIFMGLCVLLELGYFYFFEVLQGMQRYLMSDPMNLTLEEYNYLLTAYSVPNILMPLFCGYLINKLGYRMALFSFSTAILLGSFLFLLGGIKNSYNLLLMGRGLFGMGAGSQMLAHIILINCWFKKKELFNALAASLCIPRLFSSLSSYLTPFSIISNQGDPLVCLILGLTINIISWLSGIALILLDFFVEKKEKQHKKTLDLFIDKKDKPNKKTVFNISELVNNELEYNRDRYSLSFRDLKQLSSSFWILTIIALVNYGVLWTFTANLNNMLGNRYNLSGDLAGLYIMPIFLLSAILSPFYSILSDRIGMRAFSLMFAFGLKAGGFLFFIFGDDYISGSIVLLPIFLFSAYYLIFTAVFWTCVNLSIKHSRKDIAGQILMTGIFIGFFIGPLIYLSFFTYTDDDEDSYENSNGFFAGGSLLNLFLTLILNVKDLKTKEKIMNACESVESEEREELQSNSSSFFR